MPDFFCALPQLDYNALYQTTAQLALAISVIVLSITRVKHDGDFKWCIVHIYMLHCAQMVIKLVAIFNSYTCIQNNQTTLSVWIQALVLYTNIFMLMYFPIAYCLLQSLSILGATAAFQFPFFYKRYFDQRGWRNMILACHLTAIVLIVGGNLIAYAVWYACYNLHDYAVKSTAAIPWSLIALMGFAVVFLNSVIAIIYKFGRMKYDIKIVAGLIQCQSRMKVSLSLLLYASVPTLWMLPQATVNLFGFVIQSSMGCTNTFSLVWSPYQKYIFALATQLFFYTNERMVFVHVIATFIALGPYRRALLNIPVELYGKLSLKRRISPMHHNIFVIEKAKDVSRKWKTVSMLR